MGDGRWAMGDGRWAMGDGRWAMGGAPLKVSGHGKAAAARVGARPGSVVPVASTALPMIYCCCFFASAR
jgi:hypothetical protein